MKHLLAIFAAAIIISAAFLSCSDDDNKTVEEVYRAWNQQNETWLKQQQARKNPDGTPYFQTVVPSWNPGAYILIHYFNDRAETAGNLSPLYNSTVDTRYELFYCDDTELQTSASLTSNGPGIFRTRADQVVQGWTIALMDMHCGDTAEVILPYGVAYGITGRTNLDGTYAILPYSNLRYNMRLVDIPYYELPPN